MTTQYTAIQDDLEQLATGGEGIIYRLRSRPTLVLKEYKPAQLARLNAVALSELIDLGQSLQGADGDRLRGRTIWPTELVERGPQVVGFLMPALSSQFYRKHGLASKPKQVLCDWNQVVYQRDALPPHMVSEIPNLSVVERIELVKDLAHTVELLHRHDIVIGDMSGKNLIWSTNPVQVIIIDCDSFRMPGGVGVCVHKESPGWVDPTLQGAPTTKSSDIYKLGVAAFRLLWREPDGVVTSQMVTSAPRGDIPEDLVAIIAASVSNTGRPAASDWVRRFEKAFRFGRRPVLAVNGAATTSQLADTPSDTTNSIPRQRPRLVFGDRDR